MHIVLFFLLFLAQLGAHGNRPVTQTNTIEILGGADLGILIPVADFQFKGRTRASDPIVWLNEYEHLLDRNIRFTLIFDPFDTPFEENGEYSGARTFAKWCLLNDNFMGMTDFVKKARSMRSEAFMAGKEQNVPVYRFTWKYEGLLVEQLFLTVRNYGFCLLATYPEEEAPKQSKYWDFFVENTLPYIEKVTM